MKMKWYINDEENDNSIWYGIILKCEGKWRIWRREGIIERNTMICVFNESESILLKEEVTVLLTDENDDRLKKVEERYWYWW